MAESLSEVLKKKQEIEKKYNSLISETFLQITEDVSIGYNPEKEMVVISAYKNKSKAGFTINLPKQKISELINHLSYMLDNY
jgi:hypothetical protein